MTINDFKARFGENIQPCIPANREKTSSIVHDYNDIINHFITTTIRLKMRY